MAAPAAGAASAQGVASGSFLDFPLKGYRLHFQIGLFASYRLMQLVLPDMIELGRGGIVNISSLAAFIPGEGPYERAGGPTGFAYGGNKAAMRLPSLANFTMTWPASSVRLMNLGCSPPALEAAGKVWLIVRAMASKYAARSCKGVVSRETSPHLPMQNLPNT